MMILYGRLPARRCKACGANLAIVGLRHRCRGMTAPAQAPALATMPDEMPAPPPPVRRFGRPPLGERAMTAAERMRKMRERKRQASAAAERRHAAR